MRIGLKPVLLMLVMLSISSVCHSSTIVAKEHDFVPRVNNLIFLFDVSISMRGHYSQFYHSSRQVQAAKALKLFNLVMPPVPRWQYEVNSALLTFGDCPQPTLLSPFQSWRRDQYLPYFVYLVSEGPVKMRRATLQEALISCNSLINHNGQRTAIVILTDGGTGAGCPQEAVLALKNRYGNDLEIFGIFFGDTEIGWRNLYEVCKLTGGYARTWEEIESKGQMKKFVWDICVTEIMFPYTEIFFQENSSDLIPSEALKLESVAHFLNTIPQYKLQIDGHTSLSGRPSVTYRLALERARSVRNCLMKIHRIVPQRIVTRSWGENFPRYDNQNPERKTRNSEANLYLSLPLKDFPYDEKHLHTFGTRAVGTIYNTVERNSDNEWGWPSKSSHRTSLEPYILY